MTIPALTSEPLPGDGQVPYMSEWAHQLYHRLPEIHRTMDARDLTWTLKRYLGGMLDQGGTIRETIERIAGDEPVGPAEPEPIALPEDELAVWRAARVARPSALGDPVQADAAWLPWLAQMIGAHLDPAATLAEQRDSISEATLGYRAGTRASIEAAARTALTGSHYVRVLVHVVPDVTTGLAEGTEWDITIVTRASETPDQQAVIDAVIRQGVKPAGAVLHSKLHEATWDAVEATFPTWADWDAATWTQIEEAGLSYADVPDNLAVNPSFESGTTGWTALNASTITQVSGGVDSVKAGRSQSTSTGAVSGIISTAAIGSINDERTYEFGISIKPHVALASPALKVTWYDSGMVSLSTTSVAMGSLTTGAWNRVNSGHLAPTGAANAKISVDIGIVAVSEYADIDAILFRLT